MDTISLTPQRVEEIFSDCMFKEGEDRTNYVLAEGIIVTVGFHPERLTSHKQEIEALLDEPPNDFKESAYVTNITFDPVFSRYNTGEYS